MPADKKQFDIVEEVTQIYKIAADHYAEKEKPVDLSLIQGNLGKSLTVLATTLRERKSDLPCAGAIDALRKSVPPVLKHERPKEWLANFIELGTAFHLTVNHGQTERRFSLYEEAVEIYREALSLTAGQHDPKLQAHLQNRIGLALAFLGEHDQSDTGLRRAPERIRARFPYGADLL